jgi:hypothetical protein
MTLDDAPSSLGSPAVNRYVTVSFLKGEGVVVYVISILQSSSLNRQHLIPYPLPPLPPVTRIFATLPSRTLRYVVISRRSSVIESHNVHDVEGVVNSQHGKLLDFSDSTDHVFEYIKPDARER